MAKMMSLEINGITMQWDENSRRASKPCKKCGKATQGRSTNGGGIKTPACCGCAIDLVMEKTLSIFGKARK